MAETEASKLPPFGRILSGQKPESTQESPIEPDLAIIDPHHHLRDRPGHLYLLPELLRDITRGHKIEATVAVECTAMFRPDGPLELRPVGETEFLNGIAAMSASGQYGPTRVCAGFVSYADFGLGRSRVQAGLEAHMAAGNGRLRGIRNTVAWDRFDDIKNTRGTNRPHALMDPAFREGFACLAPLNLSFDTWLYFTQLDEAFDLAAAFPQTTIIIDHCGGPVHIGPYVGKHDEVFSEWRTRLSDLARLPNVFLKIGGLGMITLGFGLNREPARPSSERLAGLWRPYIETCIDLFGPNRCMFESNFPPDKKSCDYGILWNGFKRVASQYTAAEKASLFKDTASKVYRLT
ncbi:MAG TPA: amidohydrolase family protein [Beijerinckiaceae bacterium]|nr:amidohydrolase family protein [Beijerinckiaceae bacterium]